MFRALRYVLGRKKYASLTALLGLAYAIAYMVVSGIITYNPATDFSQSVKIPFTRILTAGPIGEAPSLLWIPTKHMALSINFSAAMFTLSTAFLVGSNIALLAYNFGGFRSGCRKEGGLCAVSITPPLFTMFSCCAGGPILAILGAGAFAALMEYSLVFQVGSIGLLVLSLLLISRRLGKAPQVRSIGSPG